MVKDTTDMIYTQSSLQQTSVQQPAIQQSSIQQFSQAPYSHQQLPSSGQVYYVPAAAAYSPAMYQASARQRYPAPSTQEYQQPVPQGYPMTGQYQQSPGSPVYMHNTALQNQSLQNYPLQNQAITMQNYGVRGHYKPRVRHDIYRPART